MVLPPPSIHTTWFDDDGELTELDSDDEEDLPPPPPRQPSPLPVISSTAGRTKATRQSTQTATEKSRVRRGLKNTVPCLKPPRTTNYSASSLFDWIQDDLVDLNPDYQRGVVWTEAKQMALIDSLFCNYYVPPIVFTVKRKDDGSEIRVCIDGKQRLTSIHRFMLGEIAYKDATSNRKSYYTCPPGSKKKLVTDPMRNVFKNKQITCVEYEDITEEQEREIFQRVQLGVSLAPSDRLAALNSPYADLVRSLRYRIESTQGFEFYLNWGVARGKDFQALAQIVYLIENGRKANKAEPTTSRLETFLSNQTDGRRKELQETAENVMDIYCRIASHPHLGCPLLKNLSPLEFVMAAFLIFIHLKKLTDTQLSDAIARMRNEFGKASPDRKINTKNFKFIHSFILKEVPKLISKLNRGPANEKSAFDTPYNRVELIHPKTIKEAGLQYSDRDSVASGFGTVGKRKRDDSECTDEIYIVNKRVVSKQKLEVPPTPPLDTMDSSRQLPTKTEVVSNSNSKTRTGRLPAPRSAISAKTVVKRSPAKAKAKAKNQNPNPNTNPNPTAVPVIVEKKGAESQVVKPTVRPPASARISSGSTRKAGAAGSQSQRQSTAVASTATTSASASVSTKPVNMLHTSTSISAPPSSAASVPDSRPPLPGRSRAAPSAAAAAAVASSAPMAGAFNPLQHPPPPAPPASAPPTGSSSLLAAAAGGGGALPQISLVQITTMPQQEVRRTTTPHQIGSANTDCASASYLPHFSSHQRQGNIGGRGLDSRLAPLWNAKAAVGANMPGGSGGVGSGSISGGGVRGMVDNSQMGSGSASTPGVSTSTSASAGNGRRSGLPKFNKIQPRSAGSPEGEARWNADMEQLLNVVQGGQRLTAATATVASSSGATAAASGQGNLTMGMTNAWIGSSTLSTPRQSPVFDGSFQWPQPQPSHLASSRLGGVAVMEQVEPTRDPRIAFMQRNTSKAAAAATAPQTTLRH